MLNFKRMIAILGAVLWGTAAWAATLGPTTDTPTIEASGTVDYFEFGPEGDLSTFGADIYASTLKSLDASSAQLGFGVGFDLSDPGTDASGGFVIVDDLGLYLSGDLIALGYSGNGVIELQFGDLMRRDASEWTDTVLMTVIFNGVEGEPFGSFFDGEFYDVDISILIVGPDNPVPAVPLPAAGWLLLGGLSALALRTRTST